MTNKYEGKPCKTCRSTLRYLKSNTCVECAGAYNRAEYKLFRGDKIAATQQWHTDNLTLHNEMMRAGQLKRKFGLTVEDYDRLLSGQGGACAICRQACPTGRRLAVDHCHKTGAVRGLLCHSCNLGIGKLGDDADRLMAAARYLQSHSNVDSIGLIDRPEDKRVVSDSSPLAKGTTIPMSCT